MCYTFMPASVFSIKESSPSISCSYKMINKHTYYIWQSPTKFRRLVSRSKIQFNYWEGTSKRARGENRGRHHKHRCRMLRRLKLHTAAYSGRWSLSRACMSYCAPILWQRATLAHGSRFSDIWSHGKLWGPWGGSPRRWRRRRWPAKSSWCGTISWARRAALNHGPASASRGEANFKTRQNTAMQRQKLDFVQDRCTNWPSRSGDTLTGSTLSIRIFAASGTWRLDDQWTGLRALEHLSSYKRKARPRYRDLCRPSLPDRVLVSTGHTDLLAGRADPSKWCNEVQLS